MTDNAHGAPVVGDLSVHEFVCRLTGAGLAVRLGPFDVNLRSNVARITSPLYRLYRDYPLLDMERVFHAHVWLRKIRALPRLDRALVRFTVDGRVAHDDLPAAQALAVIEWGLNLVIALRTQSMLLLHSAVVERFGGALLLPASPGHGKTTLCAGLIHRGWRLFSDEFGLVSLENKALLPLPRPLPLKNESIEVIRAFAPEAEFGPQIPNTRKGTVVHVKAPGASIRDAAKSAAPAWIVFPRWRANVALSFEQMGKAECFMLLATNAFNYEMLGERSFSVVRQLADTVPSFRLVYSNLEEATQFLSSFAAKHAPTS